MDRSRSKRAARLGVLAGTGAAKHAAVRTANVVRSKERADAAMLLHSERLARQVVASLGSMRGAAMKFGQLLSILDTGVIPPGQRELFQAKLAELQDDAPKMSWRVMRAQLERELGVPLNEVFAGFDRKPVAAASIGQVYRARLSDGRAVAVKVQYPGVDETVVADLKNIRVMLGFYRLLHPGLDVVAFAGELEQRLRDELDYELAAANTRAMADAFRGHPFIRIPDVIGEWSRRRVLITEWIDGRPLSTAFNGPVEVRNRVAEIVFRFYGETPYRLGMYSGDPHPGNSLLLDDGTIAFLDFGLLKRIDHATGAAELTALRACAAGETEQLAAILQARGFVAEGQYVADELYDTYLRSFGWYLRDVDCEVTTAHAREQISALMLPQSTSIRRYNLPVEHVVRLRAEVQVAAILGQLRPRLNLYAIAGEWVDGADPVTELGRA
ncbi:ABC1 kinase family protein [Nocardia crassostreae]|uniref:ABC1 kinase family protein n=1 Tax=Nocardia crassostreae TaxID=53428 RepID=UPI000A8759BD|nr:AarF/ABC1/UbiB kinase family protein [Nocardia crassostreae]